jgi:DNA-directed RNA polymerase specialized sigma24 family protein
VAGAGSRKAFCSASGLSIQQTAEVMGISPATVKRHSTFARAWLYRDLSA